MRLLQRHLWAVAPPTSDSGERMLQGLTPASFCYVVTATLYRLLKVKVAILLALNPISGVSGYFHCIPTVNYFRKWRYLHIFRKLSYEEHSHEPPMCHFPCVQVRLICWIDHCSIAFHHHRIFKPETIIPICRSQQRSSSLSSCVISAPSSGSFTGCRRSLPISWTTRSRPSSRFASLVETFTDPWMIPTNHI